MAWSIAERVEQQARYLREMMERLGVEPELAAREMRGIGLAAASRRCLSCASADECGRWLAGHPTSAAAPPFCPNRDFFARCRERETAGTMH